MTANTVRLHRVLPVKPEKVYRAFLEADAMAKWLPPNGFTCTVHHFEAKVGGKFRMSFRNFTTGNSHSFGGDYVELVPHSLIRYTDTFDDPNLPHHECHGSAQAGFGGHRDQHRTSGHPAGDSGRSLLSRLAGITEPTRSAGDAGNSWVRQSLQAVKGGKDNFG